VHGGAPVDEERRQAASRLATTLGCGWRQAPAQHVAVRRAACGGTSVAVRPGRTLDSAFVGNDQKTLTGSEPDLGRLVAAVLGLKPVLSNATWENLFVGFDSGRTDVGFSNITVTEQRKEKYDFAGYRQDNLGFEVVKSSTWNFDRGVENLAGKTVSVSAGTNQEKILPTWKSQLAAQGKTLNVTYFPNQNGVNLALGSGKIDASPRPARGAGRVDREPATSAGGREEVRAGVEVSVEADQACACEGREHYRQLGTPRLNHRTRAGSAPRGQTPARHEGRKLATDPERWCSARRARSSPSGRPRRIRTGRLRRPSRRTSRPASPIRSRRAA
jgi:hypothetical protein